MSCSVILYETALRAAIHRITSGGCGICICILNFKTQLSNDSQRSSLKCEPPWGKAFFFCVCVVAAVFYHSYGVSQSVLTWWWSEQWLQIWWVCYCYTQAFRLLPLSDKTTPTTKTCSVVLCTDFVVCCLPILEPDYSAVHLLPLAPPSKAIGASACTPVNCSQAIGGGDYKSQAPGCSVVLSLCVWALSGVRPVCCFPSSL